MGSELTSDLVRSLLDYSPDTGEFRWKHGRRGHAKAGEVAGSISRYGYVIVKLMGRQFMAHRLAWLHSHGQWPKEFIDHIDGNRANNRIANLRDVSRSTNLQNQKKAHPNNRSTGLLGVSQHKPSGRFEARIKYDGKAHKLGVFDTPQQAQAAYLAAKRKHHQGNTL